MYYLRVKWHFIWTLFKDIIGKRGRVETRWANVNSWRWATGLWKLILLLFCFSVWDFSQQSLAYLLVRFSFLSSAKKLVISLTVSHKGLFISFFFFGPDVWHGQDLTCPTRDPTPYPLQEKLRILIIGSPGKSLYSQLYYYGTLLCLII